MTGKCFWQNFKPTSILSLPHVLRFYALMECLPQRFHQCHKLDVFENMGSRGGQAYFPIPALACIGCVTLSQFSKHSGP